jgi:hypothetical protein
MNTLDIDHGCYSGPLETFQRLQVILALLTDQGNEDSYTAGDRLGEWPSGAPDDPLLILLVHDPLEGRIKWQHASYLADRLEEVEALMIKTDSGVNPSWLLITQQFVRGLRTAAHYRQDVRFCPN